MSSRVSFQFIRNLLIDVLKVKLGRTNDLKPLIATYFVTSACNFDCTYCPYAIDGITKNPVKQLDTGQVFELLKILRRSCPNIYFSGGEPLLRPDMVDILKQTRKLGFKAVMMVTNMSLIHKKMEALDYLSDLVVSFNMVESSSYSKLAGARKPIIEKSLQNIMQCAKLQKEKNFRMTANFVANQDTLGQMHDVIELCKTHNIRFTMGPELRYDETVDPTLSQSAEYKQAINDLLKMRKNLDLIIDTPKYLATIKNLAPFECYPTLIPRIDPNGDLSYPCKAISAEKINILEAGSYEKALRIGQEKYGPLPTCSNVCYQNCFVMPSQFVKNPVRSLL